MSHIFDLLSRVKQAEQKKGVPPGLMASMDSSRRRSSFSVRVVLLISCVLFAVALGVFTLFLAGSFKGRQPEFEAAPTAQPIVAPVAAIRDKPRSTVSRQNAASSERQEKVIKPSAQAAQGAPAVKEENAQVTSVTAQDTRAPEREKEEALKADSRQIGGEERSASRADRVAHELYLASNYERAGDGASSIASYRKAIELDPGNYKAMNNIASILLKAGSTPEAVPYIKDSLSIQDGYVPALVNMGIALARQGAASEAEAYFGKALSIEPSSVPALLNMAVLCERSGRDELAAGYYGRLKSLGHPEGASGLNRLR